MSETNRERATNWLIEHNHHGCHLDVNPSADMPLPADVDSLAALLEAVERRSNEDGRKPDDPTQTLEGYTDRAELGVNVRAVIDAIAEVVRPGETTRAHVLQVLAHVVAGALDGKAPGFVSAYFARIRDMNAELTHLPGGPAWSTDDLQEHLDIELAQVVEDTRRRAGMDAVTFSGTVSGFLLRNGLALAAKHGAPTERRRSSAGPHDPGDVDRWRDGHEPRAAARQRRDQTPPWVIVTVCAEEPMTEERPVKSYRQRDRDGAVVHAHRKANGDWLIEEAGGGSFRTVSDWYFTMTYAPLDASDADVEEEDAASAALDLVDGAFRG